MITIRHLDAAITTHVRTFKEVLILLGARQVGKTTMLTRLFPQAQYATVDNEHVRSILDRYDISAYRELVPRGTTMLILDEVHLLKDPGRAVKILYDQLPEIRLIVTGSSAFWIKNRTTESLAGRKIEYHLFPLTMSEYLVQTGSAQQLYYPILRHTGDHAKFPSERIYPFDLSAITQSVMRYGLYPATVGHSNKELYLTNLAESVVFRDLLELSLIENRSAARNLLKLLAFQTGNLVNFSELAEKLSIDVKTVRRYLTLFEQSSIVFTLPPYMKSGRKEIGKMAKVYFFDVGLRNAIIGNFNPMNSRPDSGALFENLVVSECYKANVYGHFGYQLHFWRTTDGSEVDLVLSKGDTLIGLEVKSSSRRTNQAFLNRYPTATLSTITPNNYL
ncbi:MAG: ATP-binding protein [Candidatus Gottesmanbacteria bacterium]|nr:ATP-binding protein [Candidatus Gottesmanbacteria bacterium]